MNNDKTKTAEEWLRNKLKAEGKSYAFTDGEELYIAEAMEAYAEQKLLSTPSQEKMVVEFAEWLINRRTGRGYVVENGVKLYDDTLADGTYRSLIDLHALFLTSTGQQAEAKKSENNNQQTI